MATVRCFEDLICWQKSRILANFVFDITDRSAFKDFDLKRQIRRAAISPLSNIAEGFDRGTRNEFIDALYIAKGEVGEVRSQLYIAYDRRYISQADLGQGLALTDECARLIQSFAEKVKGGARSGTQFKHVPRHDPIDDIIKGYLPKS
ncbi:MAG: four helix bundle protein [bacterium]|nr:four helix bundle protein [bacterium]